jgi:putative ABC transport system permease protein
LLKVAARSLLQHKLRSGLSVLGIICGVIAVLVMVSIGEGAKRKVISQIERLGMTNIYIKPIHLTEGQRRKARENLSMGLSQHDVERIIAGCGYVRDVSALREISAAIIGVPRLISPQIAAVTSNYADILNIPLARGRFISRKDITGNNLVCVLGSDVCENLGEKGKIGRYIRIETQLFKVVGVMKPLENEEEEGSAALVRNTNEMVFIPLGTETAVASGFRRNRPDIDELSEVIVQVKSTDDVFNAVAIVKRIMSIAHHRTEDYQIIVPQELMNQARKTRRTFNLVLGIIAGVSLIVGGIGIMNIMLASVTERTREVGIRRAVGATRQDIVTQFLTETIILTFTGGVTGVIFGIVTVRLFSYMVGWETVITLWAVILPLITAIIIGIFFGLYPAYLAASLDPIAALRHE